MDSVELTEIPAAAPPAAACALEVEAIQGRRLKSALRTVTFAWFLGSVWLTATAGAPFTSFAQSLKASNFQFGVLSAIPFLAQLLMIPGSLLTEATGQRKRIFFWGLYFQRLLWIPIAVLPLCLVKWYGASGYSGAMLLFMVLVFFMHTGNAVGGPAWISWMADLVPDRVRGKYFARRRQWGIVSALPTALAVGWVLDRYDKHGDALAVLTTCSVIFIIASIFGTADIVFFHAIPDIPKAPQNGSKLFKAWREPLHNKRFLWFAGFVATLVFAVTFTGQFVTLYIMDELRAGGHSFNMLTQIMLIVAPGIAQLLVLPIWGKAADRMGKRPLLIIGGLGLAPVAVGWCFFTHHSIWMGFLLSAVGAALWTGVDIGNFNVVLEMSGSADESNGNSQGGTSYVAVNAVIINIAGCLSGLASGAIAQWLKNWHWQTVIKTFTYFDVLFVLSAVLRLAAVVVFLPHVKEPAAKGTREALRFMGANIYNNVYNAVLQPMRFLRLARRESYDMNEEEERRAA